MKGRCVMSSEADRVEQIRREADELTFNVTDRSIGSSSGSDPDSAVRITKPDADLFSSAR